MTPRAEFVVRSLAAVAGGALVLLLLAVLGVSRSDAASAAFDGAVTLSTDTAGSALFSAAGLSPGVAVANCVAVTYAGPEQLVDLHLQGASDGELDPHLTLRIEAGEGGGYGDCDGFVGTERFDGSLADFTADHGPGTAGLPILAGQPLDRPVTFRFSLTVAADDAAQGASSISSYTWVAAPAAGTVPPPATERPPTTDPSPEPVPPPVTDPPPTTDASPAPVPPVDTPPATTDPSPAPGDGAPQAPTTVPDAGTPDGAPDGGAPDAPLPSANDPGEPPPADGEAEAPGSPGTGPDTSSEGDDGAPSAAPDAGRDGGGSGVPTGGQDGAAVPAPDLGAGSGVTLADVLAVLSFVAERSSYLFLLLLIVLAFVAVQDRIDRKDPKLALAPREPDLDLRFEPPPGSEGDR